MNIEQQSFAEVSKEIKFESENALHRRICQKIESLPPSVARPKWFESFSKCGKPNGAIVKCFECGEVHPLVHRCSLKFCPICAWRITSKRRARMEAWQRTIKGAKHLVLTQRNSAEITRATISTLLKNCKKLRRQDCFSKVRGGCFTVELTNESRGWHAHTHWLIDSDYLNMPDVSQAWAALVGQDFAICKIKDARDKCYAAEVTKYVVKGSELARWSGLDIIAFCNSVRGSRLFAVFGSAFKERSKVKAVLAAMEIKRESKCEACGSCEVHYLPDQGMRVARELKFISRPGPDPSSPAPKKTLPPQPWKPNFPIQMGL